MMKITHIPGDGDAYEVPARLVNWLVYTIFTALLAQSAYMVIWNRSDIAKKEAFEQRLLIMSESVGELKVKVGAIASQEAPARLDSLDYRLQMIERDHARQFYSAPQKSPSP
jgi:hypothetical protein